MPTKHCVFGACQSDSRPGRPGYDDSSVKFYRFPQPCLLLRENMLSWSRDDEKSHIPTCHKCKITHTWMVKCRRSDEKFREVRQITYNHFVCSEHFDDSPVNMDYTKYFPKSNTINISVSGRNRRQRLVSRPAAVDVHHEQVSSDAVLNAFVDLEGNEEMDSTPSPDIMMEERAYDSPNHSEAAIETRTIGTQTTWSYFDLNDKISDLKLENERLKREVTLCKQATVNSQLPLVAFKKKLEQNREMCKFYTGFTYCQLNAFKTFAYTDQINYWGSSAKNSDNNASSTKKRTYTQGQELLLFFMRLRGGFLVDDIAYRFGLSSSSVSRIVTTWIQVLYEKFDCIRPLMFPSREMIKENLPNRFRTFKNIRVIIDCAEIRCEKSSSFEQQGNCYSEYKAHTTHKFLIGCTPNGAVSFVSDVMEGSIHDREIVAQSGLIDLLDEGYLVLADRGFTIRDLTDEKGAILKIPAFLKGRDRLTPQEEMQTKEIAANRIFVEHVVGRLKNFRILQRVVPQSMRTVLSQAVFVCACLLNYHPPLVE